MNKIKIKTCPVSDKTSGRYFAWAFFYPVSISWFLSPGGTTDTGMPPKETTHMVPIPFPQI